MRTLKFIVDKQLVKQDPSCDFTGLVPGSEGYLQAEFSFSEDWDGCIKVVEFRSIMGKEYKPQILRDNVCTIPAEALERQSFKIRVIGKKQGVRLTTNMIIIKQDGGK